MMPMTFFCIQANHLWSMGGARHTTFLDCPDWHQMCMNKHQHKKWLEFCMHCSVLQPKPCYFSSFGILGVTILFIFSRQQIKHEDGFLKNLKQQLSWLWDCEADTISHSWWWLGSWNLLWLCNLSCFCGMMTVVSTQKLVQLVMQMTS